MRLQTKFNEDLHLEDTEMANCLYSCILRQQNFPRNFEKDILLFTREFIRVYQIS